jgi:hypothetical protein
MISQFTITEYRNIINQVTLTKAGSRPERNRYEGKPYERQDTSYKRKATRPWDMCWFSNQPHILSLNVEEAIHRHPQYMRWVYKNLTGIKWSVFTIRLLEKL